MTRMWMVDPEIMCKHHLLGEHREIHMLIGTLKAGKQVGGYIKYNCIEPMAISDRHEAIVEEMKRRGWNHNTPVDIDVDEITKHLPDEHKQFKVDRVASLKEILRRFDNHCDKRQSCKERWMLKNRNGNI